MTWTLKYRIIAKLSKDTDELFSISDIAKGLGVSYSHAHMFMMHLEKEQAVRIRKIGNVKVCTLNLQSPMTLSYLSLIESHKAIDWMKKNPHSEKIMANIAAVRDEVHSVLVKNKRIIVIAPNKSDAFRIFRNRIVLTPHELRKRRKQFSDAVILHGAEKYWSLLSD